MAMREEQLIYTFRGYRLDPGRRRLSDPRSVFFSVAEDDSIIWNEFDREGGDEIWMAELGE